MPLWELSLVFKILPRPELAAALKRAGKLLLDKGTSVQRLENHGTKDLPYRFHVRDEDYFKGSYFVYHFLATPNILEEIGDTCSRDVDILRYYIGLPFGDIPKSCTLEEEMNPPALRKSVQDLLEVSKKNKERTKPIYKHVKTYNYFNKYM